MATGGHPSAQRAYAEVRTLKNKKQLIVEDMAVERQWQNILAGKGHNEWAQALCCNTAACVDLENMFPCSNQTREMCDNLPQLPSYIQPYDSKFKIHFEPKLGLQVQCANI